MSQKKPTFYARNKEEQREWLRKNHKKENKIFLIKYKKHTRKPSLSSKEALEEAICFGWIDKIIKRIDDEKYMQCFVKRKKTTNWSINTLGYAKKLIKEGKMTLAGLKAYKRGLKKPIVSNNLPRTPETPGDLVKALEKNKKARENFNNFASSYKIVYINWIENAKRKETRSKRSC